MTKIMLVEDDNNLREIYEARLSAEGFTIVSAQDGEAALALAAREHPDLVITDVMMPKISGFEMLDILRNTENLRDVKVIMLTALGQAEDTQRAGSLGADRYLVKSQVTLEDIVKAAHDVLNDSDKDMDASVPSSLAEVAAAPEESSSTAAAVASGVSADASSASSTDDSSAAPAPADPAGQADNSDDNSNDASDQAADNNDDAGAGHGSAAAEAAAAPAAEPASAADVPTRMDEPTAVAAADLPEPQAETPAEQTQPDETTDTANQEQADAPADEEPFGGSAAGNELPEPADSPAPAASDDASAPTGSTDNTDGSADDTAAGNEGPADDSAVPAAEEEAAMRSQIDDFLNSPQAAAPVEAPEGVSSLPDDEAPDSAAGKDSDALPPEEDEAEFAKDDMAPDMGQLSVREEAQPGPEPAATQPETSQASPTAVPAPQPPAAASSSLPNQPAAVEAPSGYPSQPYVFPVVPPPAAAPAVPPGSGQTSGDRVVAEAINDMMGAASNGSASAPGPAPSEAAPYPSNEMPTHKRIIAPLDFQSKPDIHQLLAVEEARNAARQAGAVQPPAAAPASGMPTSGAPNPGSAGPEVTGQPPAPLRTDYGNQQDVDPSSIAL